MGLPPRRPIEILSIQYERRTKVRLWVFVTVMILEIAGILAMLLGLGYPIYTAPREIVGTAPIPKELEEYVSLESVTIRHTQTTLSINNVTVNTSVSYDPPKRLFTKYVPENVSYDDGMIYIHLTLDKDGSYGNLIAVIFMTLIISVIVVLSIPWLWK